MRRLPRRLWLCIAAAVLGLAGALLWLLGPTPLGVAQDLRTVQVWPDRSLGVSSGLWDPSTVLTPTQVLPFGVSRKTDGELARARTYLHFPAYVFAPGTEILHATLYVYVDSSSSSTGEATVGAYRVLEPWSAADLSDEPTTWPSLLDSPIAVATIRFGAAAPQLQASPPPATVIPPTAGPSPSPGPSPTPSTPATAQPTSPPPVTPAADPTPPTATPVVAPTPTSPTSPQPTQPSSPLPSPSASRSSKALASLRLMSFQSPLPTPTALPSPEPTAGPSVSPGVGLEPVVGTWVAWDVTALMRAWLAGEVSDDGLALAPAPEPSADPEAAGDLLVARRSSAADPDTRPYLIVEVKVQPVTPTPVPPLPPAGRRGGWRAAGWLLIGAAVLVLGLTLRRRWDAAND